jgi:lipopolysaccharide transport system permease protein
MATSVTIWGKIRPCLSWAARFTHISYIETMSTYSGSWLGMLWSPLSAIVFSATLAFVFRPVAATAYVDFFLYVLIGYTFWGFVADSITGSTDVIQSRMDFALHNNLSLGQLYAKILVDRLFSFGLDLIAVAAIMLLLRPSGFGPATLLMGPFLLLISLASIGGGYLVNLITVFVPDTKVPIAVATRLLFFVSPVFWAPNDAQEGPRALLVDLNPIAYFLSLPRQVLGIEALDPWPWLVAGLFGVALGVVGYLAYVRSISVVRNLK